MTCGTIFVNYLWRHSHAQEGQFVTLVSTLQPAKLLICIFLLIVLLLTQIIPCASGKGLCKYVKMYHASAQLLSLIWKLHGSWMLGRLEFITLFTNCFKQIHQKTVKRSTSSDMLMYAYASQHLLWAARSLAPQWCLLQQSLGALAVLVPRCPLWVPWTSTAYLVQCRAGRQRWEAGTTTSLLVFVRSMYIASHWGSLQARVLFVCCNDSLDPPLVCARWREGVVHTRYSPGNVSCIKLLKIRELHSQ